MLSCKPQCLGQGCYKTARASSPGCSARHGPGGHEAGTPSLTLGVPACTRDIIRALVLSHTFSCIQFLLYREAGTREVQESTEN